MKDQKTRSITPKPVNDDIQISKSQYELNCEYRLSQLNKMAALLEQIRPFDEGGFYPWKNNAAYHLLYETQDLADSASEFPPMIRDEFLLSYYEKAYGEIFGIDISITPEDWLKIIMPSLLPTSRSAADFIQKPLDVAIRKFLSEHEMPLGYLCYNNCVVILRSFYNSNAPYRSLKSHHNTEFDAVINCLAMYRLIDDWALESFFLYRSEPSDKDYTEVLIMPQRDFVMWCVEHSFLKEMPIYKCLNGSFDGMDAEAFTKIENYRVQAHNVLKMMKMPEEILQAFNSFSSLIPSHSEFELYQSRKYDFLVEEQKFALWIRSLIGAKPERYRLTPIESINEDSGIKIIDNDGIIQIHIPGLLPRKKQGKSVRSLRGQLMAHLKQFFDVRDQIPMSRYLIAFVFCYDQKKKVPFNRCNSNIEVSAVLAD